jgi:hypothetical protein
MHDSFTGKRMSKLECALRKVADLILSYGANFRRYSSAAPVAGIAIRKRMPTRFLWLSKAVT